MSRRSPPRTASPTRFRFVAEFNYVGAGDDCTLALRRGPPRPTVPPRVAECLAEVTGGCALLPDLFPDSERLPAAADEFVAAARAVQSVIRESWLTDNHMCRIRTRDDGLEGDEFASGRWNAEMLDGSPLGPAAWLGFDEALRRVVLALPDAAAAALELGLGLGALTFPLPTSFRPETGSLAAADPDYVRAGVFPALARLARRVKAGVPSLAWIPERLGEGDALPAAIDMRRQILADLPGLEPLPRESDSRAATPPADGPLVSIPARPDEPCPAPAPLTAPLRPGENIAAMLDAKRRVDPGGHYIGESVPILRLFAKIEELNRLPDDPVVIVGPSGVGKTHLARLIHDSSARSGRAFVSVSADELSGGDDTIRRIKLLGHGPNSGLSGIAAKQQSQGLLREASGGTILIDELHSLDRQTAELLRKPMDREDLRPAVGDGKEFPCDVRFVFAGLERPETLRERNLLPTDFVRRLGNRILEVPPLRERAEDIPLFVKRYRGNRRPDETFLLALMSHDWRSGDVDELICAIQAAVARGTVAQLTVADLIDLIPKDVTDRVAAMPVSEARRNFYSQLSSTLQAQGIGHGNGQQKRIASLLGFCESTVSRRFTECGLNASTRTGRNDDPS